MIMMAGKTGDLNIHIRSLWGIVFRGFFLNKQLDKFKHSLFDNLAPQCIVKRISWRSLLLPFKSRRSYSEDFVWHICEKYQSFQKAFDIKFPQTFPD